MTESIPAISAAPRPAPRGRALVWALSAVAIALLVMGSHLVRMGGDITALVAFGEIHEPPLWRDPRLPESTVVHSTSVGYDGQYYHLMALAPFANDPRLPVHRRQRLLYPLAAWLIAFGRPEVTAHALALTSLLSVAVAVGLLANLFASRRQSQAWSLVGGLSAGALLACQLLCPDALLVACLAGAVWAFDRRRWGLTALCLGAAILTKESAIILWAALLVGVIATRSLGRAWPVLLAPAPWAAWVVVIHAQTGEWTVMWDFAHQRTIPLAGWLGALTGVFDSAIPLRRALGPLVCALLLPALIWVGLGARGGPRQVLGGALLLWCVSALLWGDVVWSPFVACARNLAPLTLLAAVLAADPKRRGRWAVGALAFLLVAMVCLRALLLGTVSEVATVGDLIR